MRIGMVLGRVDLNDGVASHLDTLTEQLAIAGHAVTLLTGPVWSPDAWQHRKDSLARHSVAWEQQPTYLPLRASARWLRDAVARRPVDVLHVHGMRPLAMARMACRWQLPLVATAHPSRTSTPDPGPAMARLLKVARPLYRPLLPSRAIGVSSEMGRWFSDVVGMPAAHVRVVLHGVDSRVFRPISPAERAASRSALGIAEGTLACAIVGRFDEGKRHETAVAACATLTAQGKDVTLVLAGSGDPVAHVERLRELADPGRRVQVICRADLSEVRSIYAACDVVLSASEREAFALVIAEGMLCGLVPVRTPTGGAVDQIEPGVSGLVFPVGDGAALANHLRWLIDNPCERATMAAAATRRATERFSAQVMTEKTVNVYRELVEHADADPRTLMA